jgi:ribonuclease D
LKKLYSKYDKTKIKDLPRVLFQGRIVVVLTETEAEKAVRYLLKADILGFDTETRPSFKKGQQNKVSLLQVSTHDTCFLFRLNRFGLCPAIKKLLETKKVRKIGLSWDDDIRSLKALGDFKPQGFFELQQHMLELGIEDISLAKLYANIFGQRISKREQLSNWESDVLSTKQQGYAATDAWACIMLYEEYMRLKTTNDFVLEKVVEEEKETIVEDKKNEK